MSKEYTRDEAITLIDTLWRKLAEKIEEVSSKSIDNAEESGVELYLRTAGGMFTESRKSADITKVLPEYDNETIAKILSKSIQSAIALDFGDDLSEDFLIVEEKYRTEVKFESFTMQDYCNYRLMNKKSYLNKMNTLKQKLSIHGLNLSYTNEKFDKKTLIKEISDAISQYQYNIGFLEQTIKNVRLSKPLSVGLMKQQSIIGDLYKDIEKNRNKINSLIEISKEIEGIETIDKAGCKVISIYKMLKEMQIAITLDKLLEYLDEYGNLSDKKITDQNPTISKIRIESQNIFHQPIPQNTFIIAVAMLGMKGKINGGGTHFVLVKKISFLEDKNGKRKIQYEIEPSSSNDNGRIFSSEDVKSIREAKVAELMLFTK